MEALDEIFELFTKERRRFVLYYLENQDGPVGVEDLAAKIQEWESETEPSSLPDDAYRNVIITLKHKHLPKAAQAEFIEYDPESNTIELTGTPTEFRVILSVVKAIEQPENDNVISISGLESGDSNALEE